MRRARYGTQQFVVLGISTVSPQLEYLARERKKYAKRVRGIAHVRRVGVRIIRERTREQECDNGACMSRFLLTAVKFPFRQVVCWTRVSSESSRIGVAASAQGSPISVSEAKHFIVQV